MIRFLLCCACCAILISAVRPSTTHAAHRRQFIAQGATAAAAAASTVIASHAQALEGTSKVPTATAKVFLDVRIMEPLNESNNYSSASARKGRVVMELYGSEAPKTVERFLSYMSKSAAAAAIGDEPGPSYASSLFVRLVPGERLDAGRISGLNRITVAGTEELQFNGRIFPATPSLESNSLKHDTRGLLSKRKLEAGPEFSITLGPSPAMDATNVVFGRVIEGEDTLQALEQVPLYSSGSTQAEGSAADNIYRAQKRASLWLGEKVLKDERAIDRTGTFLRRVDVVQCGIV